MSLAIVSISTVYRSTATLCPWIETLVLRYFACDVVNLHRFCGNFFVDRLWTELDRHHNAISVRSVMPTVVQWRSCEQHKVACLRVLQLFARFSVDVDVIWVPLTLFFDHPRMLIGEWHDTSIVWIHSVIKVDVNLKLKKVVHNLVSHMKQLILEMLSVRKGSGFLYTRLYLAYFLFTLKV